MRRSLDLYWNTIRHLRPRQIAGRPLSLLRRKLQTGKVADIEPVYPASPRNISPGPDRRQQSSILDPSAGTTLLLNVERSVGFPPEWAVTDAPLLWQFNLHYFEYLSGLEDEHKQVVCQDWIEKNPPVAGIGWHPYPTSLRLINWIKYAPTSPMIVGSLYGQAHHLYTNIETHLGGNHLLENARALLFAATFFSGDTRAEKWKSRALSIFDTELKQQILSDGGHFERSPMYHSIILEGLLDAISLLPDSESQRRDRYTEYAGRMLDFLMSMTHPDGHIALFNDATQEIAMPTDQLQAYAAESIGYSGQIGTTFPETGYFVHRSKNIYICIDGGAVGPDHLPAHAHADIFSYELSVRGQQFIVDSGVFEYEAGAMRDYVRSTRAHNTVDIDGVDQIECWASFRVARRYAPQDISFNSREKSFEFSGRFSGYGHLIGDSLAHHRSIVFSSSPFGALTVSDTVSGKGNHMITSRIHLHPDVNLQLVEGGGLRLQRNSVVVRLITDSEFRIEDSSYCPEFGMRLANKVIVLQKPLAAATSIEYSLHL